MAFLLSLLLLFSGQMLAATGVTSGYDEKENQYVTKGKVTVKAPSKATQQIAKDFREYRIWALQGINGDSENSRKFISIIKDIVYHKQGSHEAFTVHYDVDLIFPFNRSDETLNFAITGKRFSGDGGLSSFTINLNEDSMVIETFQIIIDLADASGGQSFISFSSTFRLAGIFDIFFSLSRYRENVEWRILRIIDNLNRHAENSA